MLNFKLFLIDMKLTKITNLKNCSLGTRYCLNLLTLKTLSIAKCLLKINSIEDDTTQSFEKLFVNKKHI